MHDDHIKNLSKVKQERHRKERAKRGWSHIDAWSGDTHICQVIGEIAAHYRKLDAFYPANMSPEEWNDILDRISKPLLRYAAEKYGEDEEEIYEDAKESLKLFAEWFAAFWN